MVGPANLAMTLYGQPLDVSGATVSADVFARSVCSQRSAGATSEEDLGGNNTVFVLSHEFLRRLAGGTMCSG